MTKLEQLAALVAKQGAAVRAVPAVGAGETEVARVVTDLDADVLAAAHNALPDLVGVARVAERIAARARAGKSTLLVADRKALLAASERLQ